MILRSFFSFIKSSYLYFPVFHLMLTNCFSRKRNTWIRTQYNLSILSKHTKKFFVSLLRIPRISLVHIDKFYFVKKNVRLGQISNLRRGMGLKWFWLCILREDANDFFVCFKQILRSLVSLILSISQVKSLYQVSPVKSFIVHTPFIVYTPFIGYMPRIEYYYEKLHCWRAMQS